VAAAAWAPGLLSVPSWGAKVRPEGTEEEAAAPVEEGVEAAAGGDDMILLLSAVVRSSGCSVASARAAGGGFLAAVKLSELSEVSMRSEADTMSMLSLSTQDLISAESRSITGLFLAR